MNRTAHYTGTNADQRRHTADAVPPATAAEYRAQLHTLVAAFVARGQYLRKVHEHYEAVHNEEESSDRREKLQQIFHVELDVLKESERLHEQIDEVLRILREMRLRART